VLNAKRQRDCGGRGEARTAQQLARTILQVLPDRLQPNRGCTHIAITSFSDGTRIFETVQTDSETALFRELWTGGLRLPADGVDHSELIAKDRYVEGFEDKTCCDDTFVK
jgi:hypothetical protein